MQAIKIMYYKSFSLCWVFLEVASSTKAFQEKIKWRPHSTCCSKCPPEENDLAQNSQKQWPHTVAGHMTDREQWHLFSAPWPSYIILHQSNRRHPLFFSIWPWYDGLHRAWIWILVRNTLGLPLLPGDLNCHHNNLSNPTLKSLTFSHWLLTIGQADSTGILHYHPPLHLKSSPLLLLSLAYCLSFETN